MSAFVRAHDARSGLNVGIILVFSVASAAVAALAESYFRIWALLPAGIAAIGVHAFCSRKRWYFRIHRGVISWLHGAGHTAGALALRDVVKVTIEEDALFLTATLKDGSCVHIPMVSADGAAVREYFQKHHPEVSLDFRRSSRTSPVS
jgi:hypothetical protein